jgi:Cellulase (glycosyl hydrolase family 5)
MTRLAAVLALLVTLAGLSPAWAKDDLTVQGTKLYRDGQPFKVNGVQLMAFVAPLDYLQDPPAESCRGTPPPCPFKAYVNAYNKFGDKILGQAKAFGANTILFKVSSFGLDRKSALYDANYVMDVKEGVELARQHGFIVIVALQETRVAGEAGPKGTRSPIPDDISLRAAERVTRMFGSDPGVMIEPAVEPYSGKKRAAMWKNYIQGGKEYPGMNKIISTIREAGGQNIIIVEPLSADFSDFPGGLVDPLNRTIYGLHSYFNFIGTTQDEWDRRFGKFAEQHPLIITEWNENSQEGGENAHEKVPWCKRGPMDLPLQLLHYFNEHEVIGVVAWSFDLPATFVADMNGTPRTMNGYACGQKGGGMGELFQSYFRNDLPPVPPS